MCRWMAMGEEPKECVCVEAAGPKTEATKTLLPPGNEEVVVMKGGDDDRAGESAEAEGSWSSSSSQGTTGFAATNVWPKQSGPKLSVRKRPGAWDAQALVTAANRA